MTCPDCNRESYVHKSVDAGTCVIRTRRCECGARWVTEELTKKGSLVTTGGQIGPPMARTSPPVTVNGAGGVGGGVSSGPGLLPASPSDLICNPDQTRARKKRRDAEYTSPQFVAFWGLYPRKVAKRPAATAWWKLGLDAIADKVNAGLLAQLPEFSRREMDKVPHPATWLNARRWEDERPSVAVDAGWAHMRGVG
jgi:hypothetical protein